MKMARPDLDRFADVETLAAVIAHSQIVVARVVVTQTVGLPSVGHVSRLPAAYDEVDLAILDWIAAEGRRAARGYVCM
jgi:hypothetical protein